MHLGLRLFSYVTY